jgi:hypothetical protein
MDPARVRQIADVGVSLGVGSLAFGAVLGSAAVSLALNWMTPAALVAMTVGFDGILAAIALFFGYGMMKMRSMVSTGYLEMGAAAALRRNILVFWCYGTFLACLGCFTLVIGLTMVTTRVGTAPYLAGSSRRW